MFDNKGALEKTLHPLPYELFYRFHQDVFRSQHPCYEAYEQATEAVKHVQHITAGFFSGKHQVIIILSLLTL